MSIFTIKLFQRMSALQRVIVSQFRERANMSIMTIIADPHLIKQVTIVADLPSDNQEKISQQQSSKEREDLQ